MQPCTSDLHTEDIYMQVRENLRKNGIKLWLLPYYREAGGPSHDDLKDLAQNYSASLKISVDECYDALLELQTCALENIKQNDHFSESGLATLKIKFLNAGNPPRMLTKELQLTQTGAELKEWIAKEVNVGLEKLKLIHSGKVLNLTEPLAGQGIKNKQLILAIALSEEIPELQARECQIRELECVKSDSRFLALDNQFMEIEDQFGNPVHIPSDEKQALVVAMALHEKGRSALKRDDYSRALIFLLEADEEYKRCNAQILKMVDNYAILDLDIAWCYLCLQSVANLPEAQERLDRCEQRFHASYGPNLERLQAVKGVTGNERALCMRLHLLQGIVLYHKNQRKEALSVFKKAQHELGILKVDETSIGVLVEMGYSKAEARLGLRACGGNLQNAVDYITENRLKRKESRKKAKAEAILHRKRVKLGLCVDGKQYVDPNFVNHLVNMGYNKEAARVALKNCNNVISDSIQYIHDHPQPGPSQSRSIELLALINDVVPELEAAGFDPIMAKVALHKHGGDIVKAAEDLLANHGMVDGDLSVVREIDSLAKKQEESEEQKQRAFERVSTDISMVDDDHLDLTLAQEEIFLNQYLSLLSND